MRHRVLLLAAGAALVAAGPVSADDACVQFQVNEAASRPFCAPTPFPTQCLRWEERVGSLLIVIVEACYP